jgi:hypothetical protein
MMNEDRSRQYNSLQRRIVILDLQCTNLTIQRLNN